MYSQYTFIYIQILTSFNSPINSVLHKPSKVLPRTWNPECFSVPMSRTSLRVKARLVVLGQCGVAQAGLSQTQAIVRPCARYKNGFPPVETPTPDRSSIKAIFVLTSVARLKIPSFQGVVTGWRRALWPCRAARCVVKSRRIDKATPTDAMRTPGDWEFMGKCIILGIYG